ncbi:MAG TPA: hypothetical protein VFB61_06525 [Gemmatimonadales bacterium]|nr:hypothetical protein [Gemmatimonadales bacterium]
MRLKPDGTLDLGWREQDDWSTLTPIWDRMTMEQQRQRLVEYLLRGRPGMTREEATEQIDAFS